MTTPIHFGTDGWRAVIADEFTFENVRRVADAVAVATTHLDPPPDVDRNTLVVAYDRRFLSREFAEATADVLARAGFRVLLSDAAVPSPAVSWYAYAHRLVGGVTITASHNPAKYNGVKFKAWYGGSALPSIYAQIAGSIGQQLERSGGGIEPVDLLTDYIVAVRERLDIPTIRDGKIRILHDPIYGVAAGLPARVLDAADSVDTIRGEVDTSFGGVNPEPIPENLQATRDAMRAGRYDVAICTDGDSDRLGILDASGAFVSPHKILSLLTLYLVRDRGLRGEVVKTFSTTRLIERIASSLGVVLHETPIGFKYVADLMLTNDVVIGGEESGGIGFGSFIPERDGILSGLLVAECVARAGKPLATLIDEMESEFGALQYDRRDVHRPMGRCERLIERVKRGELDEGFRIPVQTREEKDGVKLNFVDGSWLLFRKSGTEPMIRIYAEAPSAEAVSEMLDRAVAELDR